ncbi:hypothetical protein [Pseudomonas sp. Gutcm_11s]|uniref:hypothetical protein n=1 Tax=Pseudomonas sp. Gutcm_11s TaxID=3026088 RepID=UPI0023621829|nr:hypothetical protein [Pseudomonas sp. Gutcm_11s]MDD0842439.1 hypothetical protein [Pseudomonas sp. Gutcm_11s]
MRLVAALFTLLSIAGCETAELWQGKASDEYVKVVPQNPEEDVEAALQKGDRQFQCAQLYYSSQPSNKVCYVKVSPLENIQVKLLKTPETLVTDAGNTVKVVGYVLLKAALQSGYHN